MKLPASRPAIFLERVNRFTALVSVDGEPAVAHVPHTGRLRELLQLGAACRVVPAPENGNRKTDWDLLLVRHHRRWVCIDTRWANALVAAGLQQGALPGFAAWPQVEAEVRVGSQRLDFRVSNGRDDCYIEVKCVTLVEEGTALFPDAPTKRGTEHLWRLSELAADGHGAALVFVLLRNDAEELLPHREHDPAFAAALAGARRAGVRLQAWTTEVRPRTMTLARTIPVLCA